MTMQPDKPDIEEARELAKRAMELYTPPFRFYMGYIYDSAGNTFADNGECSDPDARILRVRGWGRIQKLADPEALQDEVGRLIADALTQYWQGATDIAHVRQQERKAARTEAMAVCLTLANAFRVQRKTDQEYGALRCGNAISALSQPQQPAEQEKQG